MWEGGFAPASGARSGPSRVQAGGMLAAQAGPPPPSPGERGM
ncbi:hypothetical protein HMPREF0043_01696 [Actinobaculum sp. oral taxon 183 str. F0552]|nr:hypothetical protein HMPREF0043_01696 [Actinobaculum sp. oral taxon 183 str. F0552]